MAPGNTRLPLNMGGGAVGIESVLLSLLLVSSLVAFSETSDWRLLACASCCIADWRDADRVDREGEVYRATVENAVQSGAPLSAKARAVADILMILSQEKMEDKDKVNLERMEDGIWFGIQLYRETGVCMHQMHLDEGKGSLAMAAALSGEKMRPVTSYIGYRYTLCGKNLALALA